MRYISVICNMSRKSCIVFCRHPAGTRHWPGGHGVHNVWRLRDHQLGAVWL
ncbi:hypothetical protein E2C01_082743 [Portunus trituberculatus]|uniref:Uncharacterized protein n=1 Tax=Portunus trituberculatus TaxID=210409 RepID=A0A5B7J036_PORTR|nr:hypothetical protein [Portunus trituberculatus]